MKTLPKIVILFLLVSVISACRIDAEDILQRESHLTLVQHTYNAATPVIKTEIRKESEKYQKLHLWFENNQDGWQPSPVTFAPYVVVSGQKFNLNFQGSRAVLNFEASGKWRQYVKDIKEEDFQFLLK